MIVAGILADVPHIEGLVQNQQAKPVASIQKGGRGGIVRATDRVETAGLEDFDFAFFGAVVRPGAKRPVVMMQTAALQFKRLAIEGKSAFEVEADLAKPERSDHTVEELLVLVRSR